jgi:hypothetical protein
MATSLVGTLFRLAFLVCGLVSVSLSNLLWRKWSPRERRRVVRQRRPKPDQTTEPGVFFTVKNVTRTVTKSL